MAGKTNKKNLFALVREKLVTYFSLIFFGTFLLWATFLLLFFFFFVGNGGCHFLLFILLKFSSGIISIIEVVSLGGSRGNALVDNFISLQAFGAVSAFTLSCGRGGPGFYLAISFVGGFLGPDLCGPVKLVKLLWAGSWVGRLLWAGL